MKVKVGNKIYNSEDEPIMVILEGNDKKNIASMSEKAKKYCSFPDTMSKEDISKWMDKTIDRDKKEQLEDVLNLLSIQFGWSHFSSLTNTGEKLVQDTINVVEILNNI